MFINAWICLPFFKDLFTKIIDQVVHSNQYTIAILYECCSEIIETFGLIPLKKNNS